MIKMNPNYLTNPNRESSLCPIDDFQKKKYVWLFMMNGITYEEPWARNSIGYNNKLIFTGRS